MVEQHFCTTTYVFNTEGTKCVLVKHKKLPYHFPPGGHIDENEDYFASSQREVLEELGLTSSDLTYPDYLQERDGECLQPWTIQKYTIKPNEHYHYDLVFVALANEAATFKPGESESQNIRWFEADKIDEVQTTDDCKQNVKKISELVRHEHAKQLVQEDIYLWPRYDQSLQQDLSYFIEGRDFNSWNLGDLYDVVPCNFAQKMGVDYGIFTSTGTAGLHAILMALGLKPGDEVIVPSMTFIRAVTPLNHLSLQSVIADIDKDTGNIDPESIKANITPKTRAVIVVHMWGVPADCEKISQICKANNLLMIEDFSHAHFSKYKDRYVGSFGDASFASLQRKKTVSVGEGGIIVTKDKGVYERLQQITSPGSFMHQSGYSDIDFSGYGLNMRINPFAALTVKNLLPKIDSFIENKQRAVKVISGILSKHQASFDLPRIPAYASDISWYSYKPALNGGTSLERLKSKNPWKFSDFGYPAISEHKFWDKDKDYFPFCLNIQPQLRTELPGHDAYLKGRITINIPTIASTYWTSGKIQEWKQALKDL